MKLTTVLIILIVLVLATILTWGVIKAVNDLTITLAQGIGNISVQGE